MTEEEIFARIEEIRAGLPCPEECSIRVSIGSVSWRPLGEVDVEVAVWCDAFPPHGVITVHGSSAAATLDDAEKIAAKKIEQHRSAQCIGELEYASWSNP